MNYTAEGTAIVPNRRKELQTYMQGLHYTDTAVKKFIQEIDKIDKPITFVFCGDYLPTAYSGNDSRKHGLEQHQIDYFIYNNEYNHKQATTLNKEVVAPNNFGTMALEHANIKVTPYYALSTEVSNHLPTLTVDPAENLSDRFNGKQVFVTEDSQVIQEKNLTEKQKEILGDYRLIRYDFVTGNQYSATWATRKTKD